MQPLVAKFSRPLGGFLSENLICFTQIGEVLSLNVGENICRLRAGKGMSQGDLADALGVSRQSISKWETGGAVPELEKLVKLSALFGVTLDELVTGTKPEHPEAGIPETPPVQVIVEHRGMTGRQVTGIVLLCMGFALTLVFAVMGSLLFGLLFASPLFVCGVICLKAKKHPVLWCLWALLLLVDAYLRYATGLSWATVRWTFQWTPRDNYFRLFIAWCQLLCALALLAGTVWVLGREPKERTQKSLRYFVGGWVLFILLCLPFSGWIFQAGGRDLAWLVDLTACIQDYIRLALLAGLFTYLRRWNRVK